MILSASPLALCMIWGHFACVRYAAWIHLQSLQSLCIWLLFSPVIVFSENEAFWLHISPLFASHIAISLEHGSWISWWYPCVMSGFEKTWQCMELVGWNLQLLVFTCILLRSILLVNNSQTCRAASPIIPQYVVHLWVCCRIVVLAVPLTANTKLPVGPQGLSRRYPLPRTDVDVVSVRIMNAHVRGLVLAYICAAGAASSRLCNWFVHFHAVLFADCFFLFQS